MSILSPNKTVLFTLRVCAFTLVLACGGEDDDAAPVVADGGEDSSADAEKLAEVPCDEAHVSVSPGLTAAVGDLTVRLVSSDPMRARQKVKNDWVVELVDGAGAPVTDAMVTSVRSYMIVHRHYGLPHPKVEPLSEPGRLKLDDINFSMRGPWEVIVSVQRGADEPKRATFNICVE